uniref:Speckle-type POZ protein n=1 Tax=Rhabditophanes sp. KR3021 TaxID=114890 RepID=A0AC35TGM1_9BILA
MSGSDTSTNWIKIEGPSTSTYNPPNGCVTMVEPIHLRQEWTINNFTSVLKLAMPGLCLRSQMFKDPCVPDACWQLCLYPGGKRVENMNNVSLFLKMSATSPMKELCLKAEYRFYFMDDNDQPKFQNVNIGDFNAKPPKGGHSWGLRNIPKQKVANCIRDDHSLMIVCNIELIPDSSRMLCKKISESVRIENAMIGKLYLDRFHAMYLQGTMVDFCIEIGAECFKVHKFVLASQSNVFQAMFSHKTMTESATDCIKIADSTVAGVKMMVNYLYTGAIDGDELSEDDAASLVDLAEKYDMTHLKEMCEEKLMLQATRKNVISLVQFAELYRANKLFEACLEMISTFRRTVFSSEEWMELKNDNPRLTNRILESVLNIESSPPPKKRK